MPLLHPNETSMYKAKSAHLYLNNLADIEPLERFRVPFLRKEKVPPINLIHQTIGFMEMLRNKQKRAYALMKIADNLASAQYDVSHLMFEKNGLKTLIDLLPETNARETKALFSVFVVLAINSVSFSQYFCQNPRELYSKFQISPTTQSVNLFCIITSDNPNFIHCLQSYGILQDAHQILGQNQNNIEMIESFSDLFYFFANNNLILSKIYENDQLNAFNKYCEISHLFFSTNTDKSVTSSLMIFAEICKVNFMFFDQLFTSDIIDKISNFTMKKKYFEEIIHLFINISTFCPQFINVFFSIDSTLFSSLKRFISHSSIIIPLLSALVTASDETANHVFQYDFISEIKDSIQNFSYFEKEIFIDFFCKLALKIGSQMLEISSTKNRREEYKTLKFFMNTISLTNPSIELFVIPPNQTFPHQRALKKDGGKSQEIISRSVPTASSLITKATSHLEHFRFTHFS